MFSDSAGGFSLSGRELDAMCGVEADGVSEGAHDF